MFNSLAFVVLLTPGFEEVNVPLEPLEHLGIALSGCVKQWIFSVCVFQEKAIGFKAFKYLEDS
jgi:hypothetical protein